LEGGRVGAVTASSSWPGSAGLPLPFRDCPTWTVKPASEAGKVHTFGQSRSRSLFFDFGLAHSPDLRYRDYYDDASVVASFYLKAIRMPVSTPQPTAQPRLLVDLFMDRVVDDVRRVECHVRPPYCYALSHTAWFTGLPVHLLRRLCDRGIIQAIKVCNWWMVHQDDFIRLLDPAATLQWRSNAARAQIFEQQVQQLTDLLDPCEACCTIDVLLRDVQQAVQAGSEGADYEDAEDFAWHRAEWRVRDGVVDPEQTEEALRLLRAIIQIGTGLLGRSRRNGNSNLVSKIAEQTRVALGL
jgi:hypothetical protein